ncbi:MAG: S49 family peptidase [Pseudomonadota bacterium]
MEQKNSSNEQRMPHAKPADTLSHNPEGNQNVVLEVLKEMREQRNAWQKEQESAAAERRSERRWKRGFQALIFGTPVIFGFLYFLVFLNTTGFCWWGPWGEVVGIIRIEGKIESNAIASADKIIPALKKAFTNPAVKAVVLSIDSPGGAPVESERIYSAISSLKQKYPKPIVAVINNLGASAAYMIALHTDKIIAGKYSLVGSIGAIMAPWDLSKALNKLDVSQRVYASGKLKAFMNPFTPPSAEAEAKAKQIVDQMGGTFVEELRLLRRNSLKANLDYGTGEIWGGTEAKSIGLVDAIGTLDDVVSSTWGIRTYDFGPHPEGFGPISTSMQNAVASFLENWLTNGNLQLR